MVQLCTCVLREVVSNFQESGDRSKKFNFFFIGSKRPFWWTVFKKNIQKFQRVSILAKKKGKFEIGQNVLICIISIGLSVHFHNVRTRQRKIILDSLFHKLFFIPLNSYLTILHLQLNFLSFVTTTRVKYTMFCIPFVRWILPYFRRP